MSYGYEVPKKYRGNLGKSIVCCLIIMSGGSFINETKAASKRASYCTSSACSVYSSWSNWRGHFPSTGAWGVFGGGWGGGSGGTEQVDPGPEPLPDVQIQDRNPSQSGGCDGNPVVLATGNKVQTEIDFGPSGTNELGLVRTYNHYWDGVGVMGERWLTNFDYKLVFSDHDAGACEIIFGIPSCDVKRANTITAYRPDGRRLKYRRSSGSLFAFDGSGSTTYMQMDATGAVTYHAENGGIETYSYPALGSSLITSRQSNAGDAWLYEYVGGFFLSRVTHSSGRYVEFIRDQNAMLTGVKDPAGNVHQYTFQAMTDGTRLLKSHALSAAGINETYHYENQTYKTALTGKSLNGVRFSTYTYDSTGRVASTEHAGGVNKHQFTYGAAFDEDGQEERHTIVTNPYGKQEIHRFLDGRPHGIQGLASTYCPATARSITYDANGFKDIEVTARGITKDHDHDAMGRLTRLIEAKGTPNERTTNYVWATDKDQLLSEELVGIRKVTYTYRADGRIAKQRVTNLSSNGTAGQVHDTSFTYTFHSNQLVRTVAVDGPIAGTGDVVVTTYDAYGDVVSIANSLGHTTTLSGYNGLGLPGRIVGENGAVTDYTYDARGRILRVRTFPNGSVASDEIFTYEANELKTLSRDGSPTRTYFYDAARRLSSLSEPEAGGSVARIRFTRNNASDVTSEIMERISGSTTSVFGRVFTDYDELGRVRAVRGNNGGHIQYTYDAEGNLTKVKDSLGRDTVLSYDKLNRLINSTNPANQSTEYAFNADDVITRVTDPRGLTTSFTIDGFGQLWSQSSPDTGTTTFSYNSSGQRVSMTRSGGSVTAYSFDALGRTTGASSSGYSRTIEYDSCTNGIGRLCQATAPGSVVQMSYEQDGRPRSRRELTSAFGVQSNYLMSYYYDSVGRITSIAYPNQLTVGYGYSYGNMSSMTVNNGGVISNVVTGAAYRPFGQIAGWSYGNGLARNYYYDQNYVAGDQRLTGITTMNGGAALQSRLMAYDADGKITGVTNSVDPPRSRTYEYDDLGRLTIENFASGYWESFNYDPNGNRTSTGQAGSPGVMIPPTWYNVDVSSNRLLATKARSYTHDARGNRLTALGTESFRYTYDAFNQMATTSKLDGANYVVVGAYQYNAFDQRISKAAPSYGHYRYIYGSAGRLMSEHRDENDLWTNYLWFGDHLVGFVRNGQINYVHGDHLDRPELVTNSVKSVVWRSINNAYGRNVVVDTVGGLDIGFPGQYQDKESGLWYNIHRYYDAETGRYTQPDPIGIAGGLNSYAYVGGNPISLIDPLGLQSQSRTNDWIESVMRGDADKQSLGDAQVRDALSAWAETNMDFGRRVGCVVECGADGALGTSVESIAKNYAVSKAFGAADAGIKSILTDIRAACMAVPVDRITAKWTARVTPAVNLAETGLSLYQFGECTMDCLK